MQNVGDRVRIRDGGNGSVLRIGIEKEPGIFRFGSGFGERKTVHTQKYLTSAEHTRGSRLIKVQTACVFAGAQSEGVELRVYDCAEIEIFATCGRVEIPENRQLGFGGEWKASSARMRIGHRNGRPAKCVQRDYQKYGGGD